MIIGTVISVLTLKENTIHGLYMYKNTIQGLYTYKHQPQR